VGVSPGYHQDRCFYLFLSSWLWSWVLLADGVLFCGLYGDAGLRVNGSTSLDMVMVVCY
jgi:hypothetical protein